MSKMPHDTENMYASVSSEHSENRLSEIDSGGGGEPTASTSNVCNVDETGVTTNEKLSGSTRSDSKEAPKGNAKQGPSEDDKPVEEANQSTSTESVGQNAQSETVVSDEGRQGLESQSNVEGADDSARFLARRRRGLRQYRRWSGADESSGDEQASPSRERSSASPLSLFDHLADMSSSSSGSSNSSQSLDTVRLRTAEDAPTPKALLKPKPNHKWFAVKELIAREAGYGGRWQGSERFQHRYYGSLHAVQRLELMYKLQQHRGCVNSLHFNRTGELLVTASDDRKVILWDWAADRSVLSYDSGHSSNVFQAKFLPLSGDRHIVTCARDGQVRLGVLSGTGVCKGTRLLARHHGSTHKLATQPQTPHEVLSAGEDAVILSIDVRQSKPNKLLLVKENQKKVGIYSIHSNPVDSNEFIITGEDQYIRLYDKRKVSSGPLTKFCPKHLLKPPSFLHITCGVFNYNGTEVIASYNDDDIYLFDTRLPLEADYIHKYEGHRNSITVKGVNFFGPRSEYIVSGSDCGNIFFWDKSTEAIVQWMRGDEEGVVNCLEPHPQVPILATSGLDNDIKIWVPSCEEEPKMAGLKASVITNQSDRDQTRGRRSDPFDNQQMRWLWRQIQRFEQRRAASGSETTAAAAEQTTHSATTDIDNNTGLHSSSSDDDTASHRPQCSPS